jgi:hypothetical protein
LAAGRANPHHSSSRFVLALNFLESFMQDTTVTLRTLAPETPSSNEGAASAISWPSIFGGALAITAISVIFLAFGAALRLTSAAGPGMKATAIGAIALIVAQWVASGIGGYLTGRLRTKWVAVHDHEVFFRDTAHGFLAWATAMIFGVVLLSLAASTGLGHMHRAAMTGGMREGGPMAYYVDSLYRNGSATSSSTATAPESVSVTGTETTPAGTASVAPTPLTATPSGATPRINPEVRDESSRILMRSMGRKGISDDDRSYLAQLVAGQTGLSQTDAATRVNNVVAQEQADGLKMRKGAGHFALFAALSMLIGAFVASAAAAFGGSQRDEWEEAVRSGTYKE